MDISELQLLNAAAQIFNDVNSLLFPSPCLSDISATFPCNDNGSEEEEEEEEEGNVTAMREEQWENANLWIMVTEGGIVTTVNELQPMKAP